MVFPRIYGFYEDKRILGWLEALYDEFPIEKLVKDLEKGDDEDDETKNDLMEKLSTQNAIKNMVDENLTE
jgi:hypothetical protein